MKFEVRELAKKIDYFVEQKMADNGTENHSINDELIWDLPLKSIEDLELFEQKLNDNLFRKKVVKYLLLSYHEIHIITYTYII